MDQDEFKKLDYERLRETCEQFEDDLRLKDKTIEDLEAEILELKLNPERSDIMTLHLRQDLRDMKERWRNEKHTRELREAQLRNTECLTGLAFTIISYILALFIMGVIKF